MNVSELLIDENNTVLEVMEVMDKVASKVLFVLKKGRLVAAVSDGDIRRWILKKGSLEAKIKKAANYSPKYLFDSDRSVAKDFMKRNSIEIVPIVDSELRIINIISWDDRDIILEKEKICAPVVIMAGGMGTRLYPYTKILPKPLIPVGEIPISEHIINRLCTFGCNDYYLVVNHKKNMIKAYFNEIEKNYNVYYADEDIPLGTGGGLSLLKGEINTTFILTNCDILINEDVIDIYRKHKQEENIITMVCSLKNYKVPYGVVEINKNGTVGSMKEKPTLSFFTNTGFYIVEPEVIDSIEDNQAIGFPDIIEKYKKEGYKVGVYPIGENAWLDMGQMDELEKMRQRIEQ